MNIYETMNSYDVPAGACVSSQEAWRSFHVYYSDLDLILRDCICPFLLGARDGLTNAFCERHYSGGSHVRVRFLGEEREASKVANEFRKVAARFVAERPSARSQSYSAERAREMMEADGQDPSACELQYQVNVVTEAPYERLTSRTLPPGLTGLLESFLGDCLPVMASILGSSRPKAEEALRIYFVQAAVSTGDMRIGSVAFRAHWEGFAGLQRNRKLVAGIRENYARQRQYIRTLLRDVHERCSGTQLDDDPVTGGWSKLIRTHDRRVTARLRGGDNLGFPSPDADVVRENIAKVKGQTLEHSAFLDTLFGDTNFFVSFGRDPMLLRIRVLTNLLYCLIANLGLSMIDRMSLCYFAHRAVEDYFNCDLTEQLRGTMKSFTA